MSVTSPQPQVQHSDVAEATRAGATASPVPARRVSRVAAALLDGFLAVLLVTPPLWALRDVLDREVDPFRPPMVPTTAVVVFASLTGLLLLSQWILAARGTSLGKLVVGLAVVDARGEAPGLLRGVVLRRWFSRLLGVGTAGLWFVVDSLMLLGSSRRTLHDRLSGTRVVVHGGEERRAFQPPRFSGAAFVIALAGILLSVVAAGTVATVLAGFAELESTDLDIPSIVGAVVGVFGLVLSGALAAYASRRFVVGELALLALLIGLLALELMVLRIVPVPAMQRFEVAGWLDWSVYAVSAYFALSVFLVIGSSIGFMLSGEEGADFSTRFERMVAQRHLRLRWPHYLMLAAIATLAPVLVYGILVWPLRAVWHLMRGRPVPRPLPPTVFMALLTIVGVMFGVMSLTVVLAVMGGFERDLKEKILGTNAHGVIHRYVGEFTEWREVEGKVKQVPGLEGITPFILSEVMITTDGSVTGAVLKGIDVETVGQVTDLAKNVEAGRIQDLLYPDRIPKERLPMPAFDDEPDFARALEEESEVLEEPAEPDDSVLPGIVIGREMAKSLRVWIGDTVTVMNPLGELGPQGPIPRSRTYRVAAVFFSGMYEYDAKFAYIGLRDAQRFFRMGDGVSGLELRFRNVDEARPLMRRILGILEGFPYRTKDWGEMNRNLFSALRLERLVMFILLSFQVLIACICVIATLVMLVVEKRKEVATLKAMGAREGSIMKLFVLEGLIIGAIGTGYGVAAGLLFCKLIEKFGVGLDPEVYYITRLPVVIEPLAILTVAVVSMVLVFVATIYPARRGGSVAPVEGFREE